MLRPDPLADAGFLEHLTEVAVVVSLFTAGLELRVPPSTPQWRLSACGSALRHVEMWRTGDRPVGAGTGDGAEDDAVHPDKAEAHMAEAVLGFNEQVEKVLEVAAVLVLGGLLAATRPTWAAAGLAAALFLVVRPVSVVVGLAGVGASSVQKGLMGWFGVRGVGSLYYLTHAIGYWLPGEEARTLAELVVWAVALSILVHGVSVTPLMDWYGSRGEKQG